MVTSNPRFELRAYESADCCRAARILCDLAAQGIEPASRDTLAGQWAARHPRHRQATGKQAIRERLSNALSKLAIAGLVDRHTDGSVSIRDRDRLGMASRNLDVVQDAAGAAVRPGQWSRRPEAPEHLQGLQADLAAKAPGVVWTDAIVAAQANR